MKLTERQLEKMNQYGIPKYMRGGLIRYFENRIPPGDFLSAVLQNDLMEAMGRADETNRASIYSYCMWLYNVAPAGSYGSPEKFDAWLNNTSKVSQYFHGENA